MQVKNQVKKEFELELYTLIKSGKKAKEISKQFGLSPANLSYYLKPLKEANLIKYKGNGVWEITGELKLSSLGTTDKPLTNLHALQISFPILSGQIEDKDWEIKEKLNNWIPKYTELKDLGGIKIKNNNNKSLTIWANSRNVSNVEEVQDLAFKLRIYIYNYFKTKMNVELDLLGATIKNLDIATEDKHAEGMRGKGEKFLLKHGIKAEKIFENDNRDSESHIDGSPFKFSAETNDLAWKREYLRMPFSIQKLMSSVMYIAENYKSHVGVVEKLDKILSLPKVKSHIKDTILNKNQSKIGDFI